MPAAVAAVCRVTGSILGTAAVTATRAVRQGSSTSCFLFVIFVNELIKLIKNVCQPEPFLGWVHILMLMDDAVLLSSTREAITRQLAVLVDFCKEHGMKVNCAKTKCFVVNGGAGDEQPLCVGDLVVNHRASYVYLGSTFTGDGSVTTSVKENATEKLCQVLKFVTFIEKHNTAPFIVKRPGCPNIVTPVRMRVVARCRHKTSH